MKKSKRPQFIVGWRQIEALAVPPSASEDFGFASELSAAAEVHHLRVAHLRIPPGRRAYPPLAMQSDEVFAFVLEGAPDLWVDGHLYRLAEGDGAAFNAGTGIAHTLINNTDEDIGILVCAEAMRRNSKGVHPKDKVANENLRKAGMLWVDAPKHQLGPNDGKPGSRVGRKRAMPDFVAHWRHIFKNKSNCYPGSFEEQGLDAPFGKRARFSRIGVHIEVLKAGRRTSFPHAERDEDEFVYVVSGRIDCWLDGHIHSIGEGDFVGWQAGTGITHVIINNTADDAVLFVGGEASRAKSQIWYPLHPHRDKETGEGFWHDHPKIKLGPHDGLPDAFRKRLPPKARKSAVAANKAALTLKPLGKKRRQ